jgi:hypothetical protein
VRDGSRCHHAVIGCSLARASPSPRAELRLPPFLLFASDAALAGLAGAGLLVVAALAALAERRRARRALIDAVGCMPWTALFLLAFIAGVVLLGLSARVLLSS